MPGLINAKEQPLSKIFGDDYLFEVPSYQRPYSWTQENAQVLFDDLFEAAKDAHNRTEIATPYFLGSIVLIKSDQSPEAMIIDGQQRLTTLTILLSAIRASIEDPVFRYQISNKIYQQADELENRPERYKLLLRQRERDFFRRYIQNENGIQNLINNREELPDAQKRIRENASAFMNVLEELEQPEIRRLATFIISKCYLVIVSTSDMDSAYRIFGVLNSRGKPLEATDILKAEIIGEIDAAHRDQYTKYWEDQEESLGQTAFLELFSHIRMIYRKLKPHGTLIKEFNEHVQPKRNPTHFIDKVLIPISRAYCEITDDDYSNIITNENERREIEKVNDCLQWLNRLEFKDWMPPALAFYVPHRHEPKIMASFFGDLERLSYSMLVRKTSPNERIERYSRLTFAIENGDDLSQPESPLQLLPYEQHETYEALNGPLYETHFPRTVATLMLRMDRLQVDCSATYDGDVSVEHVMPQQPPPNSQWIQWVPDYDKYQFWVHRLGNLVLLNRKKNSAASNFNFDRKKEVYFKKNNECSFSITRSVLAYQQWSEDVIEQRQIDAMALFERHWRLQGRKTKAEVQAEIIAKLDSSTVDPVFILISRAHALRATGASSDNGFIVHSGSQAKLTWDHDEAGGYRQLRELILEQGILSPIETGEKLRFTTDYTFASSSAAASVVLGRQANGMTSWKYPDTNITFGDWMRSKINDLTPNHETD